MIVKKKMNNNAAYKQQVKFRFMIRHLERIDTKKVGMKRSKTPLELAQWIEKKGLGF